MAEEKVEVEYILLHGYIRILLQIQKCMQNTSWEWTEVRDQWKKIYKTMQNSIGQRNWGGNRSVSRTEHTLGWWGNWSRGPIPTAGQPSESEEKYLRLRVEQLICGSLNVMRIRQSLPQPYIRWAGAQVSWKGQQLGAGVEGLWSDPRVRAATDCGETDWGEVRKEIEVGHACGGKPGSHGSKAILLSHARGWSHHLPTAWPALAAQQ